jgi:hypothetical protein
MRREHRKNRTRIGPHLAQPWAAERPVISVLEIGYVRRSEIRARDGVGKPRRNFVECLLAHDRFLNFLTFVV